MVRQTGPEILAPAGSMEALYAALHAGADAVYFGGKILSARAYAGNFEKEEIIEAVALLHRHKVKAHLTLNTLVKNPELRLLEEIGNTLCEAHIDAVIIQDMGIYLFFKRYFPELALHASTQMTVHSVAGAARLYELGFQRVVLSRELTLKEVRQIMEAVPLEVETFVHGAMCYCYSGQCQMSAAYGERSANRGKCAQPCRLPYQTDKTGGYLLSLKDQMTLFDLPELVAVGIDSFKIEGRMKNPEYVYTVTQMYRKYRDLALAGGSYQVDPADVARMSEVFSRGATSAGYYFMRKSADMIFPEQPKTAKLTNAKTLAELAFVRQKPEQKAEVDFYVQAKQGQPLTLTVVFGGGMSALTPICQKGEPVQPAQKKATTAAEIEKPLRQLGDTLLILNKLELEMDAQVFVPVSQLKELRRQATAAVEAVLCSDWEKGETEEDRKARVPIHPLQSIVWPEPYRRTETAGPQVSVLVRTEEQLKSAFASEADRIYLEWSFLSIETMLSYIKVMTARLKQIFLAAPVILRGEELQRFDREYERLRGAGRENGREIGLLLRTADHLAFFRAKGVALVLDHSFHIWNRLAYQFYQTEAEPVSICLSNEISYQARSQLGRFEMVIYGKLATMQTANCLANAGGRGKDRSTNPLCRTGATEMLNYITDRKGAVLGYHRNCKTCSNTLFNPVPLFLADQPVGYAECLRLELLDETTEELEHLMRLTRQLKQGKRTARPGLSEFTRGHYSKGVE